MALLNDRLRQRLIDGGAGLVGCADVSELPETMTGGLPRAISMGVPLNPAIVREIAHGPTPRYFAEYNRINALLAQLSEQTAAMLKAAGHRADPIQATTEHFDPVTLSMRVQHKTIATRAGLGWIGKSALLITRPYGPAIRLGSVLTDADLKTGVPVNASHCGSCRNCVDRCPAQAIVGDNWRVGMPREAIYDAPTCRMTAMRLSAQAGFEAAICGVCINACPWTQRYLTRALGRRQVDIAPATLEDLPTVKDLFREYEAFLPFDLSFQHFEREADNLPGRYALPTGALLLARCDGRIVGTVALRQLDEGLCEMKRLYVQPAFQGQGIGRALAQAIIEEARQIGYQRMWLDTVMEPAKNLYRSLGFTEIPPYQEVPIEGVVFMELKLA
ncbi:MAG: GNAT family N-acetyltransferase [Phycisphaerales bacterium]|nr:MAG: GNAT family N-acetyltransferase [Phycisphaerales bacterium]